MEQHTQTPRLDVQLIAQVATEALLNQPEAYGVLTAHTILRTSKAYGVAAWLVAAAEEAAFGSDGAW